MTAHDRLTAAVSALPTDQLADVMAGLMNDHRPEADVVFAAAMDEAQRRLSSAEFLALCGRLEAAA